MNKHYNIGYFLVTDIQHIPPVVRIYPHLGGTVFTTNKKIYDHFKSKYSNLNPDIIYNKDTKVLQQEIVKRKIRLMIYPSYHVLFRGKAVEIFHGGLSDKNYVESVKILVYDYVLFPGETTEDKVKKSGYLKYLPHWEIVGYPKFDPLTNQELEIDNLFNNNRKTVLYAPTWISQKVNLKMIKFSQYGESSLQLWIKEIIKALYKKYNLIIKYHSRIYRKPGDIYDQVDKLIKDLGAEEYVKVCVDDNILPYMKQADLMISDISTACYEWFHFNKPICFANPAPEHYKTSTDIGSNTYAWQAGDVLNSFDEIEPLISKNLENDSYQDIRNRIFQYTVFNPDGKATQRQITAIKEFYDKYRHQPYWWLLFTSYIFRRYRRTLSKLLNKYYRHFKQDKIGK